MRPRERKRLAKALLRLQAAAEADEVDPVEIVRFMVAHKRRQLGFLPIKDSEAHYLRQLGLEDVLHEGTEMTSGQIFTHRRSDRCSQGQPKSYTESNVVQGGPQTRSNCHTNRYTESEHLLFGFHKWELRLLSHENSPLLVGRSDFGLLCFFLSHSLDIFAYWQAQP
ncbi:hypothetical protein [Deinococcus aquatilis]|uniref:hypothetical protein n=1 Tax=Deinococcus aquatilis TaxID=519440 RepID=UPI0003609837|nr:hypothetical protein [Deinococcus aquatilis]